MKRGPRKDSEDTKEAILAAARELFADKGYDGTSMRAIAREAKVDAALVSYYFGSKSELFLASIALPVNPTDVIDGLLSGEKDQLGERIVRTLLTVWDNPQSGGPLISILRSAPTHGELLQEFIQSQLIPRFAEHIGGDDAELRAAALITQVFGLVTARYVMKLEPVASASHDEVAELFGPTLQRYLDPVPLRGLTQGNRSPR